MVNGSQSCTILQTMCGVFAHWVYACSRGSLTCSSISLQRRGLFLYPARAGFAIKLRHKVVLILGYQ